MQPKIAVCRIFFFNSNCQCDQFSKKNPIIRIFCIFGCLAVPINPDYCISTEILVFQTGNLRRYSIWGRRHGTYKNELTASEDTLRHWIYFLFNVMDSILARACPRSRITRVLEMCAQFLRDIVDRISNVCGPTHATFWNTGFSGSCRERVTFYNRAY
jgi:hypothetical protein